MGSGSQKWQQPVFTSHLGCNASEISYCVGRSSGERATTFKPAPFWHKLERATVTVMVATGVVRDCSYLIASIREWPYDAVFIVSTIIPKKQITVIDVTPSAATSSPDQKRTWFNAFLEITSSINNNTAVPVHCILEVDCLKGIKQSQMFASMLPTDWKRFSISAFGLSSCFLGSSVKQLQLVHEFHAKYITEDWVNKYTSLDCHRRFC